MSSNTQPRYFFRIGAVLLLAFALVDALCDTADSCSPDLNAGPCPHDDAGAWLAAQPMGRCTEG